MLPDASFSHTHWRECTHRGVCAPALRHETLDGLSPRVAYPGVSPFAPSNSDMAAALVAYPINLPKQTSTVKTFERELSSPSPAPPLTPSFQFSPFFPPLPFKHFPSSQCLHSLALKLTIPLTLSKEKYATPLKQDGRLNGADKITSSSLMI